MEIFWGGEISVLSQKEKIIDSGWTELLDQTEEFTSWAWTFYQLELQAATENA